jgi:hypothetical protein
LLLASVLAALAGAASAQERVGHDLGEFELLSTPTGVLIAAPHGTYDANTAPLAVEAARRLGAGYVIARGFTVGGTRINVNRPTEGAGVDCAREPPTARAKELYDIYAGLVSTAAGGRPLELYVEIHGNSNPRAAQQVEVATVGISPVQARKASEAYAAMRLRARDQASGYPELGLLIEPHDRVFFTASCAKKLGILAHRLVPRSVHFELPRSARERDRLGGTATLVVDVVRQLVGDR